MCDSLGVNESGYYKWLKRRKKLSSRQLLLVRIMEILSEHEDNENYGARRMQQALKNRGIKRSYGTIVAVMRQAGLLHKHRKPNGITKADTETQEKENLIKRDFSADRPLKKLLTDITEAQCSDGKIYISAILDCFNGEIIALEMRRNMKKELCIATVRQLRERYGKLEGTLLHSDRGCQYTSYAFREQLAKQGIIQSLSGTGRCYDNARMESFFATLKKEKLYKIPTHRMTVEEVMTVVFRYVFGYYNTQRVNSFNPNGMPPVAYREFINSKLNVA